ncbi:hypothetical protein BV20DRAFT_966086 [Pilatotrama ljubarskyi]|nr:hypothetical protein BV20DRAFT_966086 [Pilatotrama ljubarskyi]
MSGAYDERLLASAPAASRAEKQEGYDIDLLDDRHHGARGVSTTPPPVPILASNHAKAEVGGYTYASRPATPWYKTRKWVIICVLGGLVVIGAIVGGAVGGTVGHSSKSSSAVATKSGDPGGATGPAVSQADGDPGQAASRSSAQAAPTSSKTDAHDGEHDPGSALSSAISAAASATTTPTDAGQDTA